MDKANLRVSPRTRKLVDMCQGQDVDDFELSEPSDPFATDDSDEYIASTSHHSTSDELGASDTEKEASPQINIVSNIVLFKPQLEKLSNNDQDIWERIIGFEVKPFEFDTSFKNGSLMIDDETIKKISTAFEETLGHNNESAINRKKTIYESPLLVANKYKKSICKYCDQEVISRHFSRHLERKHKDELEVKELMDKEPNSKEKKQLLLLIRNQGCLEDGLRGEIIPKKYKPGEEISERDFALCKSCKGFFKRLYLSRHVKNCFAKPCESEDVSHPLTQSYIYTACQRKYGEVLSKLQVKKDIFERMQADEVTKIAANDILIIYYGEDLLKK
nr:unnamed protein product [Callosobruchus analis]